MWTFDNFPSEQLGRKHGFSPDQAWLDEVRLASVRLARGCSGSFVSSRGLVMTNHHCAHRCIQDLSTSKKDYVAEGFWAAQAGDEIRCPSMEVNQLVEVSDVTEQVSKATENLTGRERNEARKAEMSRIEKGCATSDGLRCDVVSLYHGGQYHLYRYRRFQDVRLVFAPEVAIAFYGGDPDNFNFPRYDVDVAFLRIYVDGKPASTPHHFAFSRVGAKKGDLTFVSGHPGSTSRLFTVAQLAYERDYALPERLIRLAEARGMLRQFRMRGAEQRRISRGLLFGVENALKALKGRRLALVDPRLFQGKSAAEKALRSKIASDPKMKDTYAKAWDAIAQAQEAKKRMRKRYRWIETGAGFWSQLFSLARTLVRAGDELPKPNEKRLREFAESQLPALKQHLFSKAPIHEELEILTLTTSFTQLREELGASHPIVKQVLGKKTPQQAATSLIQGTKLHEPAVRKALFDGGSAAIEASSDPLIQLARGIDGEARAVRKAYEDHVEAVEKRNGELIAQARFRIYGTSVYPDATFTLRLSYGQVRGWNEDGKDISPTTTIAGAFERHTGADPFALPKSWLEAKDRLALETPMNFCTTNDIVGGNSGSPVINRKREIVGLIFDGNIHSLGGKYAFEQSVNRAVAVHSAAILEALDKVYRVKRLREELGSHD